MHSERLVLIIIVVVLALSFFHSNNARADTLQSYSLVCKNVIHLTDTIDTFNGVLALPKGCLFTDNNRFVVVVRQPMYGPVKMRIGTSPVEYYTARTNLINNELSFDLIK